MIWKYRWNTMRSVKVLAWENHAAKERAIVILHKWMGVARSCMRVGLYTAVPFGSVNVWHRMKFNSSSV